MWYNKFVVKIPTTMKNKKEKENLLKVNKNEGQELRKMLKKQQKTIKINQKNTILMSGKISVAPINKGFS